MGAVVSSSALKDDSGGGSTDSLTVTLGSAPAAGDYLVLVAVSGPTNTLNTPSGFTQTYGDGALYGVFTKVATGSEGTSFTVSNFDTAGILFAFLITGVAGAPLDVSAMATNTNSGPSVTTTVANDLILSIYIKTNDNAATTVPTGFTLLQNDQINAKNGGPIRCTVAYGAQSAIGSTGTFGWSTASGTASNLVTMAIASPVASNSIQIASFFF